MVKEYWKGFLKRSLKGQFDTLVTRPHLTLRVWFKKVVRYALNPLRLGPVLLQLVKHYLSAGWRLIYRRLIVRILKWLQVQHQTIGRISRFNPLRMLRPPIELTIHLSESRYRRSYRRFGEAVAALRKDMVPRKGILLVSGTLGAGGAERQA